MKEERQLTLRLTVRAYESLLQVTTGFVEKSALAFGLAQKEALALTLATEEIFLYLCHVTASGTDVDIRVQAGSYCVKATFEFACAAFPMRAFNITAAPSFENDAPIYETGLLLAFRLVDRFHLDQVGNRLALTLIKHKSYSEATGQDAPAAIPLSRFVVRRPDTEEIKTAIHMIQYNCRDAIIPPVGRFPGLIADMLTAGDVDAAVAVDASGHMGGIVLWSPEINQVADCFGPYIFHRESDAEMPRLLMDRCLEAMARTNVAGLINRYPGTGLPYGYFEPLGSLMYCKADRTPYNVEVSYRHLGEDKGMNVWAHPDLVPFLESQYKKFVLPREIQWSLKQGETTSPSSVLFTLTDRSRRWAVLRPIVHGEDDEAVLGDHVRLLEKEGLPVIFFEMDLKESWQAHFTPALLKNGFEPRIVVPYGGRGDLLIFQHKMPGMV